MLLFVNFLKKQDSQFIIHDYVVFKSLPLKHNVRYIVYFYKTNKFTGTLRSSKEGEVYWVKKEDLLTLNLASDMEDMYQVFCDDDLSEFYYHEENGKFVYDLK